MKNCPAVSVIVINWNKKDILRLTLTSVLGLEWPNLELLVVDNASTDGSAEMVENEFGASVRLIRRTVNCPTAARNEGFFSARGEFLLSIDNDIILHDTKVIKKGLCLFQRLPNVGILAFKVGTTSNPEEPLPEHWWYPIPANSGKDQFFYTDLFSEGAAFIRASALRVTGGYDEDFFQYWEDVDLALRMIRNGFDVLFCPNLSCGEIELRSFLHRKRTFINYLALRNRIWTVWKHYPFARGLRFIIPRVAAGGVRSVRYGWTGDFLRAIRDGVLAPRVIREKRRPLRTETWAKIDRIRKGEPLDLTSDGLQ